MKLDLEKDEILAIMRALDKALPSGWDSADPGLALIHKIATQVGLQENPEGGVVEFDLRTN
jgi:hypothetical protein